MSPPFPLIHETRNSGNIRNYKSGSINLTYLEQPVQGQGSRLVVLVRQGRTEDESTTVHEGRPECLHLH